VSSHYTLPRLISLTEVTVCVVPYGHTCASPVYLTETLQVMQFIPKVATWFAKGLG